MKTSPTKRHRISAKRQNSNGAEIDKTYSAISQSFYELSLGVEEASKVIKQLNEYISSSNDREKMMSNLSNLVCVFSDKIPPDVVFYLLKTYAAEIEHTEVKKQELKDSIMHFMVINKLGIKYSIFKEANQETVSNLIKTLINCMKRREYLSEIKEITEEDDSLVVTKIGKGEKEYKCMDEEQRKLVDENVELFNTWEKCYKNIEKVNELSSDEKFFFNAFLSRIPIGIAYFVCQKVNKC